MKRGTNWTPILKEDKSYLEFFKQFQALCTTSSLKLCFKCSLHGFEWKYLSIFWKAHFIASLYFSLLRSHKKSNCRQFHFLFQILQFSFSQIVDEGEQTEGRTRNYQLVVGRSVGSVTKFGKFRLFVKILQAFGYCLRVYCLRSKAQDQWITWVVVLLLV